MRPRTLFVVMGPCLFLSKWFDMFCSCSIVSYDISKLRVTSLFCFWIIHEHKSNTIELEWGGLRKKVELQNIAFFHLVKFCEEQGSIKSPLATVSMNNAPQGWKTLGDLLYLCRLLTLLPLFFPSSLLRWKRTLCLRCLWLFMSQ